MDVPVAANVLGTMGAVCWSIQVRCLHVNITLNMPIGIVFITKLYWVKWLTSSQLIPQIVVNYRRHNTIGLQPSMMLLWACAGVPLGAYNIASNFNVALLIQPQILTVLSLITWAQCYYYGEVRIAPSSLLCTAVMIGSSSEAALRIGGWLEAELEVIKVYRCHSRYWSIDGRYWSRFDLCIEGLSPLRNLTRLRYYWHNLVKWLVWQSLTINRTRRRMIEDGHLLSSECCRPHFSALESCATTGISTFTERCVGYRSSSWASTR